MLLMQKKVVLHMALYFIVLCAYNTYIGCEEQ